MPGIQYWHEVNESEEDQEEDYPKHWGRRIENLPVFDRGRDRQHDFQGRYRELDFND